MINIAAICEKVHNQPKLDEKNAGKLDSGVYRYVEILNRLMQQSYVATLDFVLMELNMSFQSDEIADSCNHCPPNCSTIVQLQSGEELHIAVAITTCCSEQLIDWIDPANQRFDIQCIHAYVHIIHPCLCSQHRAGSNYTVACFIYFVNHLQLKSLPPHHPPEEGSNGVEYIGDE